MSELSPTDDEMPPIGSDSVYEHLENVRRTLHVDPIAALDAACSAEDLSRASDDDLAVATAVMLQGWAQYQLGYYVDALTRAEWSISLLELFNVPQLLVDAQNLATLCCVRTGDVASAARLAVTAVQSAKQLGDRPRTIECLVALAELCLFLGRSHEALKYAIEARTTSESTLNNVYAERLHLLFGDIYRALGNTNVALRCYHTAEGAFEILRFDRLLWLARLRVAEVYAEVGRNEEAQTHGEYGLQYATNNGYESLVAAYTVLKVKVLSSGDCEQAALLLSQALEIATGSGDIELQRTIHKLHSDICEKAGEAQSALIHFKRYHDLLLKPDTRTAIDKLCGLGKDESIRRSHAALESRIRDLQAELERKTRDLQFMIDKEQSFTDSKSQFVGLMSHEFRTPLTVVQSCVSLISLARRRGLVMEPEELDKHTSRMQAGIDQMTYLVDSTTKLLNLQSLILSSQRSLFDLVETIRSASAYVVPPANTAKEISLVFDVQKAPFEGMRDLFITALIELIRNAYTYSPDHSVTEVRLLKSSQWYSVRVSSDGPPIPVEERDDIFELFRRGGKHTEVANERGLGVGLAVVRMCSQALNGKVHLESDAFERNVFVIELPVPATPERKFFGQHG